MLSVMKKSLQVVVALAKDLSVVLLLDYYGNLLPLRQRKLVEYYYCDDLSLAEISETEGITRQGARDSITRAVLKLRNFEETVGFVKKAVTIKDLLEKYKASKSDGDLQKLSEVINDM